MKDMGYPPPNIVYPITPRAHKRRRGVTTQKITGAVIQQAQKNKSRIQSFADQTTEQTRTAELYSPEPALDFGSERGSEREQWQT